MRVEAHRATPYAVRSMTDGHQAQRPAATFPEPLRIISDIHFRHPAGYVVAFEQLRPLHDGVRTLVFNGDSFEMCRHRATALAEAAQLADLCRRDGVEPVFINGNHDPDLTSINHLDLAGGTILVTHGDLMYSSISPWSPMVGAIAAAHARELAALGEDALAVFEQHLSAAKRASLAISLPKLGVPQGVIGRIATVLYETWPPWRPLQIFRVWREAPARAAMLAEMFRPAARFVIVGHTHRAGIWQQRGRTVINTGSFLPLSGRFAADLAGGRLSIRRICRHRDGSFAPGPVRREFAVGDAGDQRP